MTLSADARNAMLKYLEGKPKGKFGAHRYEITDEEREERQFFERYQNAYQVPIEGGD